MGEDMKRQEDKWREKQKAVRANHKEEVKELKALLHQTKELLAIEREGGDKKGAKYQQQLQELLKVHINHTCNICDKINNTHIHKVLGNVHPWDAGGIHRSIPASCPYLTGTVLILDVYLMKISPKSFSWCCPREAVRCQCEQVYRVVSIYRCKVPLCRCIFCWLWLFWPYLDQNKKQKLSMILPCVRISTNICLVMYMKFRNVPIL